jgi:hypothetical protein
MSRILRKRKVNDQQDVESVSIVDRMTSIICIQYTTDNTNFLFFFI